MEGMKSHGWDKMSDYMNGMNGRSIWNKWLKWMTWMCETNEYVVCIRYVLSRYGFYVCVYHRYMHASCTYYIRMLSMYMYITHIYIYMCMLHDSLS